MAIARWVKPHQMDLWASYGRKTTKKVFIEHWQTLSSLWSSVIVFFINRRCRLQVVTFVATSLIPILRLAFKKAPNLEQCPAATTMVSDHKRLMEKHVQAIACRFILQVTWINLLAIHTTYPDIYLEVSRFLLHFEYILTQILSSFSIRQAYVQIHDF